MYATIYRSPRRLKDPYYLEWQVIMTVKRLITNTMGNNDLIADLIIELSCHICTDHRFEQAIEDFALG